MKIIDYGDYPNLTLGSLGSPPYTPTQYTQAYDNIVTIQGIIDDAKANNIKQIVFPYAEISLCYVTSLNTEGLIKFRGDTEYDFSNSKWDIIYDSDNRSPHDSSSNPTYTFEGRVLTVKDSESNVILRRLELVGDIYHRSFTDTNERLRESSIGFTLGFCTNNIEIHNFNIRGFMADGIANTKGAGNGAYRIAIWTPTDMWKPGYYNDTSGSVVPMDGAYVTDLTTINMPLLEVSWQGQKPYVYYRRTFGFARGDSNKVDYIDILWFDEFDVFISRTRASYSRKVRMPLNARKARMQRFGEQVGLPSISEAPGSGYTSLMIPYSDGLLVKDTTIRDCHRGGFSNAAFRTTLDNVKFINNGTDSGIGAPQFPSTTRYAINIEDTFGTSLLVKNCYFNSESQIHIAYYGLELNVVDCIFEGNVSTTIAVYSNVTTQVSGCTSIGSGTFLFFNQGSASFSRQINVFDCPNIVVSRIFIYHLEPIQPTEAYIDNCNIRVMNDTTVNDMFISSVAKYNSCNISIEGTYIDANANPTAISIGSSFTNCDIKYTSYLFKFMTFRISDTNILRGCNFINIIVILDYSDTINKVTVENCRFTSTPNNKLRTINPFAGALKSTAISNYIRIKYSHCIFTDTRIQAVMFNNAPASFKKVEMRFENCRFVLTDDVITGSTPSFIYAVGSRATKTSPTEKYFMTFQDCEVDFAFDVPTNFPLIRSLNPNNHFVTIRSRQLEFNKDSLAITTDVTLTDTK